MPFLLNFDNWHLNLTILIQTQCPAIHHNYDNNNDTDLIIIEMAINKIQFPANFFECEQKRLYTAPVLPGHYYELLSGCLAQPTSSSKNKTTR